MTRLYALCVLVLLLYGLVVPCFYDGVSQTGVHYETIAEERQVGRWLIVEYACRCRGWKPRYSERYRDAARACGRGGISPDVAVQIPA